MEYENIALIENKLTFLMDLISKLSEKHPERLNDLNYLHNICQRYVIDIDVMKRSLDASNGHGNEGDFKEMILHINESLIDMRKLLESTFKRPQ